jgi:hypothetical protein
MKKNSIVFIVLALIAWLLWYTRYTKKIETSKAEVANLDNRAITEEEFLQDREDTEEAQVYREEQEDMQEQQPALQAQVETMKKEAPEARAQWSFNKIDPIHFAKWWVEVILEWDDAYIIFSEDFSTPNGPDLYVLLSEDETNDYSATASLNIGALTANEGKQIYKVSREEIEQYDGAVKIRCRAFDVVFSVATL